MDKDSFQNPNLKITGDGSHTLYSERFSQHYHNPNGAVAESRHVFFEQNGLINSLESRDRINIMEIGFGTGLNLLLLADYIQQQQAECMLQNKTTAKINYHGIEGWPISGDIAASLNYGEHLHHPELANKLPPVFDSLERGENSIPILPNLDAIIFYGMFDEYNPNDIKFDFIFHDAFSPGVNPNLWTGSVFKKLLQWSRPETILTTYCAASKAKGAMAWAGWKVAKAPGAPGKREMTMASPSAKALSELNLKRINEERLARRYEEGDF